MDGEPDPSDASLASNPKYMERHLDAAAVSASHMSRSVWASVHAVCGQDPPRGTDVRIAGEGERNLARRL